MSVNDNYDFNFILESVTLTGKRIRLEPLIVCTIIFNLIFFFCVF